MAKGDAVHDSAATFTCGTDAAIGSPRCLDPVRCAEPSTVLAVCILQVLASQCSAGACCPFTDFDQVFEGFLKTELGRSGMPGSSHVLDGNFVVSKIGEEHKSLGPANWSSAVHPGCNVSLAVVFSALKVSLLRCPRPGCGVSPSSNIEAGKFITW